MNVPKYDMVDATCLCHIINYIETYSSVLNIMLTEMLLILVGVCMTNNNVKGD